MDDLDEELHDQIWTDLCQEAGFHVPVLTTRALTERLEVPEDWQEDHAYADGVRAMLGSAAGAMRTARPGTNPIPFTAALPSQLNGRPETLRLAILFDGDAMRIRFADERPT